jgi:multidrug efflux pump subunit AcrA (membrane-fusion protein)
MNLNNRGKENGILKSRKYRLGNTRKATLLVLILVSVFTACNRKEVEKEGESPVVSVRVAKAERQAIKAQASALGTISPREQATVSANINAQIKQMALLKNKVVRAGDVIATLNSRDLQAQRAEASAALQEAEVNLRTVRSSSIPQTRAQDEKAVNDARANVANARALYERRKRLFDQGGIAQKEVEAAQLALTLAENELKTAESAARLHSTATNPNDLALASTRVSQAQQRLAAIDTQLSYATVRAPISGTIIEQFQFEGEYATTGGKLVTIADTGEVIVKAPFADIVVDQLQVGDEAIVEPQDLPGEKIEGAVSLISRSSDSQNRAVEVWVRLRNEGGKLRANSAAQVVVTTQVENDALVVPKSAVTLEASNGDEGTVMVVGEDEKAHETKVQVGIRSPELMQITAGLKGGETVVIEGNYALPDNTRVAINKGEEEEKEGGGEEKKGDEK